MAAILFYESRKPDSDDGKKGDDHNAPVNNPKNPPPFISIPHDAKIIPLKNKNDPPAPLSPLVPLGPSHSVSSPVPLSPSHSVSLPVPLGPSHSVSSHAPPVYFISGSTNQPFAWMKPNLWDENFEGGPCPGPLTRDRTEFGYAFFCGSYFNGAWNGQIYKDDSMCARLTDVNGKPACSLSTLPVPDSGVFGVGSTAGGPCPCNASSTCGNDGLCYENCYDTGNCLAGNIPRKNTYFCDYSKCM